MGYFKEVHLDYINNDVSDEIPTLWELQAFDEACKLTEFDDNLSRKMEFGFELEA